jgi:iron complex outermembrane receptor protein
MDIRNLLVAQRTGDDQFVGKNAGKTKHQGFEMAAFYRGMITPRFSITPFLNYTYNNHSFIEFIDGDADYSGNPLTGVPRHRINTGLQVRFLDHFYWHSTHQYVSAIPLTDANSLSSDSFNVVTTKFGFEKNFSEHFSLGIALGVNNVFNVRYAQSVLINTQAFGGAEPRYYYPGNDRNYYSSLKIRYTL